MKKFKFVIMFFVLLLIYSFLCAFSYAENTSNNLSNSIFRLHVIANSDSDEDQALKYLVRDNLINYMNELCRDCASKEEAINIVTEHQDEFLKIAKDTVYNEGYDYNVSIEIGNFEFPTKTYGDISFPSGFYDALRVKIGEANGKNWWCVMFPPLCFVDVSKGIVPDESKELISENLNSEEYALVSENKSNEINFKFKLLEFFNNSGLITAKNN